jgi:RHS repeat-associated protein
MNRSVLLDGLDDMSNDRLCKAWMGMDSTPLVEAYTLQGSGHPQRPSNRYASVAGFGLSSAASYIYDDRANLKYDGRFLYRYDYLNRLQEVWRLKLVEEEEEEGERLLVVEREALDEACNEVQQSVPEMLSRLPREHTDPTFRSRLKARLRGGVIRLIPEGARRAGGCWTAGTLVDDADVDLVAVYGYDHWNRRTVTVVVEPGLADTGFHVFDGWRQVAQHTLHVSGSSFYAVPTKQFVWGARLDEMLAYRRRVVVSSVVSWEVYYVLHGGQDTAARLVDAGGVVREQYEYDPYGMVKVYSGAGSYLGGTSPLGLAFLCKAVRLDAETGLFYMRNRYYSTGLGRFLTRDPIGVWRDEWNIGGETAYAGCRPLAIGDPSGLQGQVPTGNELGSAIAVAAASYRSQYENGNLNPGAPGPEGFGIMDWMYSFYVVVSESLARGVGGQIPKVSISCCRDMARRVESLLVTSNPCWNGDGDTADAIKHCVLACCLAAALGQLTARDALNYHERDAEPKGREAFRLMDNSNNNIGLSLGGVLPANLDKGLLEEACLRGCAAALGRGELTMCKGY